MPLSEDYKCDGQINLFEYIQEQRPVEYGDKGCRVCYWNEKDKGCHWKDKYYKSLKMGDYPNCYFEPSEYKIPRMCANCKYSNEFCYEIKEKYAESVKRHNGYTREAADDPKETPNIYCIHKEGSLNRRTEYKDREQEGFGIGHWNRQHEWDTCDRWEVHQGPYLNFKEILNDTN